MKIRRNLITRIEVDYEINGLGIEPLAEACLVLKGLRGQVAKCNELLDDEKEQKRIRKHLKRIIKDLEKIINNKMI